MRSLAVKDCRLPFDGTENVEQCLQVLDRATHFSFQAMTRVSELQCRSPVSSDFGVDDVDWLKLDCEGAEYLVIS